MSVFKSADKSANYSLAPGVFYIVVRLKLFVRAFILKLKIYIKNTPNSTLQTPNLSLFLVVQGAGRARMR
jgi:hypothetical protein